MKVSELRDALKNMPGEISIYIPSGEGISSVKHIFRGNLIGVDQFCELTFYGGDPHTPDFQDALIERETGFKDRRELLDAYKALKEGK
jgi:hypothetical protein